MFGFKSGDESWEILQNGTDRVGWHSADFSGDGWKTDFEARYPKNNTNINRLKTLSEWLVSTDTGAATGNAISAVTYDGVTYTHDTVEYRLAKFSAELSNYFIEEAIIFYYLYTEMFLSIDQREKNAFPTYLVDEGKWIVLFYDADSSCGTDNKGNLSFDYFLEDIDYTESGDPVYNGQNSVLWKNLRATRYDEIMAMYQELRTSDKVNYENVIGRFEAHQGKWPEAIFNEDMQIKCIDPLILDGDGLYLPMLQGKKEQWMKWWLYNRFRYLDSKYVTGTSMTNRITIRAHQKASVFLKSYLNMYGHVYFNAAMVEHRMVRGQEYEFEWPASGAEDPVIGINDADLLTSLGDLSPLMVELIDVSGAPHISELKIGDGADDYANYSLNSITLGNNKLLRRLDLRNCPNLTMSPDVSGCSSIEEILCEGSSVQGIKLPDGGILKTLHLPATVVNLNVVNQPQLSDFVLPSFDQITTLRLENAGVLDAQMLDILNVMAPKGRIRLIGFTMNAESYSDITDLVAKLDTMRGLDEGGNNVDYAQVSGTIYMDMITQPQLNEIAEIRLRYPGLNVVYNSIETYTVSFYNDSTFLYSVENVSWGSAVEYVGDTPVRPNANENEDWEFNGWDPVPTSVTENMDCYAQYKNMVSQTRLLVQRLYSGEYENDSIETIGEYAFYNCTKLIDVNVPNVRDVGGYAFYKTSLTEVDMPLVTYLPNYTFNSVTTLTKAHFEEVTEIGTNVFQHSSKLSDIYFPKVTKIGSYAFATSPLESITDNTFPSLTDGSGEYNFTNAKNISLSNLRVISPQAFKNGKLETASFPAATSVNQNAFEGNKALTDIHLPLATKFHGNVFNGCISLTKASFPSLSELGNGAFYGCSALRILVLSNTSMVRITYSNALTNTPFDSAGVGGYIIVPSALIDSYKTATNWSTYYGYGNMTFLAIEDYTVDGAVTGEIDWDKVNALIEEVSA